MRALIIGLTVALATIGHAQEATLLHGCETLAGVTVTTGGDRPGTQLVNAWAAEYVTEGVASIRLGGHVAPEATGTAYVAMDLVIPETDFTGRALVLDLGSTLPEPTQAVYVRGLNAEGVTVLSWQRWESPLSEGMAEFVLVPGSSEVFTWEGSVVQTDDLSGVVKLRIFAGSRLPDADFNLYVDNIRVVAAP